MSRYPAVKRSPAWRAALWAALLTLVVAPWGAAAQSYPAGHAAATPAHGGVLTQGFKNDLATLDPAIGYDWDNWPAEKMVFDGLLDYNEDDCRATRVLLDGLRALKRGP